MPDRPLHILHLTAGSDAGGVSRYIFELCRALNASGHRVTVAGERGAWHWLFEKEPWTWIDAPLKGGPLALRRAAAILRNYAASNNINVIHAHYRRATLVARRLQKHFDIPLLYTAHLSHMAMGGYHRWLSDFGDMTLAPSIDTRKWLLASARIPEDCIALIPHGVDTLRYRPPTPAERSAARAEFGITAGETVAAYVGRLDHPKNLDWLIDLAAASRNRVPHATLLLAGEGPQEQRLRKRIDRERLNDRVRLLGHRDPLNVYFASDALLLASWREGFSLACAEAMACGVPVFRTRTSGTTDLIVEGVTGQSVPIDRRQFIARAIEFLSDQPALRRMGASAHHRVAAHFKLEDQIQKTISLYKQLASKPV